MKLLVIDDHPVMLEGLALLAAQALPQHTVLKASSFAEGHRLAQQDGPPDLILLDPGLPDMPGPLAIRGMVKAVPGGSVMVISASDQAHDQEAAWAAGAHAFASKAARPEDLIAGLHALANGQRVLITSTGRREVPVSDLPQRGELSARQFDVLSALCDGLSNKMIAQRLQITEKTVKSHVGAIFEKLKVANRTQAALVARRLSLVNEDLALQGGALLQNPSPIPPSAKRE